MSSKWEPHKSRIRNLFIEQKMPLKDVKDLMEIQHGFIASKTEYERQLRKCGMRKNAKTSDLMLLKKKLEVGRRNGKETEVYFRGVLVDKDEVRRKANRRNVPMMKLLEIQRCKTPPEFLVITCDSASELYLQCVRTAELPWLDFVRQVNSIENLEYIINMPGDLMRDMIPAFCPNPSPLLSVQIQQLVHHLCAIMPVEHDENITTLLGIIFGGTQHTTIEFLKLVVYVLSNKLLKPTNKTCDIFCEKLLLWFRVGHNHRFLKLILSHKTPTIEAFMEVLFSRAVYEQDELFITLFLASGINPDTAIWGNRLWKKMPYKFEPEATPLTYLVGRCNRHLMKVFMEAGADINAGRVSPLQMAVITGNIEPARIVITAGASLESPAGSRWSPSPLQLAAYEGDHEMSTLLLENGADINATSLSLGSPLACAIEAGAHDLAMLFLSRGADIHVRSEWDWSTALQIAAEVNDHIMVERLLERGADPNQYERSSREKTPLGCACQNGNLGISQALLKAGASVNRHPVNCGMSALVAAVASGNYDLVLALLELGADVDDHDTWQLTALETAAEQEDIKMVEILLSAGATAVSDDSLCTAVRKQNLEIMETLVKGCTKVDLLSLDHDFLLSEAVQLEDMRMLQNLMELGFRPDRKQTKSDQSIDRRFDGFYASLPLPEAAQRGNLQMVEALMYAGVDSNRIGGIRNTWLNLNALQAACRTGNSKLAHYLLERGADLNWPAAEEKGRTALQAAVESGEIELVRFLIDRGAVVNSLPPDGFIDCGITALQLAVKKKRMDLVRLLMESGAQLESAVSPSPGRTCLSIAAERGDTSMVKFLIEHGAEVNWRPEHCYNCASTALPRACKRGHYETVILLIKNGADVNKRECEEDPLPLTWAALYGYLRIAKLLLESGADVNARSHACRFKSALIAAAQFGRIDTIKLLLNHGADITSLGGGQEQFQIAVTFATLLGHHAAAKFLKHHQIYARQSSSNRNTSFMDQDSRFVEVEKAEMQE